MRLQTTILRRYLWYPDQQHSNNSSIENLPLGIQNDILFLQLNLCNKISSKNSNPRKIQRKTEQLAKPHDRSNARVPILNLI